MASMHVCPCPGRPNGGPFGGRRPNLAGGVQPMIAALVDKVWDVIVVGAGLAGGLAGRRLAESGASVLFLERGPLHPRAAPHDGFTDVADPAARASRATGPSVFMPRSTGARIALPAARHRGRRNLAVLRGDARAA